MIFGAIVDYDKLIVYESIVIGHANQYSKAVGASTNHKPAPSALFVNETRRLLVFRLFLDHFNIYDIYHRRLRLGLNYPTI